MSKNSRGYSWRRDPDGTYTLFAVPNFQECVDRRGKQPHHFGLAELQELVKANQAAQKAEHYPSVHWGHNDGKERPKLGEASNFRIGKLRGKYTIFSDISGIDEEDFKKIKRGKYPHISIEVTRTLPRRIGSIAFLSSNAPYFVLPNIGVGEEVQKFSAKRFAVYAAGDTTEYINKFSLKGVGRMKKEMDIVMQGKATLPEEEEMKDEYQDDEAMEPEEEVEEFADEEGDPLKKIMGMLEAFDARLNALEGVEEEAPSTANPISPPYEGGQMKAGQFDAFMDLKKEVQILKKKNRETEIERMAADTLRHFSDSGLQVDPEKFKTTFRAKVMKYGQNAGLEYISEVEDMAPMAPVGGGTQFASPSAMRPKKTDLHFLEKYKEEGPEEYQKAKEAAQMFTDNHAYFASINLPIGDYVDGEVGQVRLRKANVI